MGGGIAWAAACGGCLKFSPFTCDQSTQCDAHQGGMCSAEGSCAYPDPACPSGMRFDENAASDLAGECVGGEGTGTTTGTSTLTTEATLDTTQTTTTLTTNDTSTLDASGSETMADSGDQCGAVGQSCCDAGPACNDGLDCIGSSCGCVTQIEIGDRHSCAVLVTGELWCWGANDLTQLGDSVNPFESTPVAAIAVVPDDPIREAEALNHTCVRSEQGNVRCFGDNGSNQVDPALMQPTAPATPATWIPAANHLGVGVSHSCATDGTNLVCWGSNGEDQLTSAAAGPGPITFASGAVDELAIGGNHGCYLQGGAVLCWGSNSHGQQATDTVMFPAIATPTAITLPAAASRLALGRQHTCALLVDNTIACWGRNDSGQLGDTTGMQQLAPVLVALPPEADTPIAITAGFQQTCMINDFGELWCWGSNASGQLMLEPDEMGNDAYTYTPRQIDVGAAVLDVGTGQTHSCALTDDARVLCWGTNSAGQIGDGTTNYAFEPHEVMLQCPS
jgi:alpha-tubulin suppressor-like RCC1 family protein